MFCFKLMFEARCFKYCIFLNEVLVVLSRAETSLSPNVGSLQ
jgi:hypothetical protein